MEINKPKRIFAILFKNVVDYMFNDKPFNIYSFYISSFDNNVVSKFEIYKKYCTSDFSNEESISIFKVIFNKTQTLYHLFNRFYLRKTRKKMLKYNCQNDLKLQPLSNYSEKMKITLYHQDTEYLFVINDLMRIIDSQLLHSEDLFSLPTFPKNPYNNIVFTKANLYNLYFHMRTNNYLVPHIFELFFKSDFSLKQFGLYNETYLRSKIIEKYHESFTNEELYEEIILMLRLYNDFHTIFIHPLFDEEVVIETFRQHITYYWHYVYNYSPDQKKYYNKKLILSLQAFKKDNPLFGRIFISRRSPYVPRFKVINILSREIPDFNSVEQLLYYMKTGKSMLENPEVSLIIGTPI
jgi:hypothetical protein